MPDVLTPETTRLETLEQSLRLLEQRIASVEQLLLTRPVTAPPQQEMLHIAAPSEESVAAEEESLFDLSQVGRTILILGGAYLLRAITQSAVLPEIVGMLVGLAYALFWLFVAEKVALDRPKSAIFEAGIATVIALSVTLESAVRFRFIDAVTATAMIAGICTLVLVVAVKRKLALVAWVGVVGSVIGLVTISVALKTAIVPAVAMFCIAAGAAWCAAHSEFRYLEWFPAFETDVLLFAIPFVLTTTGETRLAAAVTLLTILALHVCMLVLQTLVWDERVTIFEIAHSAVLLPVTLGGAAWLSRGSTALQVATGVVPLIAAALLYRAAKGNARTERPMRNYTFLGVAATLSAIVGSALLAPLWVVTIGWAAIAAVLAWRGSERAESLFAVHAAMFGTASVIASGLLVFSLAALFAPIDGAVRGASAALLVVLMFALVSAAAPTRGSDAHAVIAAKSARLVMLSLAVAGLGGVAFAAVEPLVRSADHPAAVGSVVRTVLLSAAALLLALGSRREADRVMRHMVNPVLIICALKLLLEDFRVGNAASLFVSLAAYGSALVIAAKLRQRKTLPHAHAV